MVLSFWVREMRRNSYSIRELEKIIEKAKELQADFIEFSEDGVILKKSTTKHGGLIVIIGKLKFEELYEE